MDAFVPPEAPKSSALIDCEKALLKFQEAINGLPSHIPVGKKDGLVATHLSVTKWGTDGPWRSFNNAFEICYQPRNDREDRVEDYIVRGIYGMDLVAKTFKHFMYAPGIEEYLSLMLLRLEQITELTHRVLVHHVPFMPGLVLMLRTLSRSKAERGNRAKSKNTSKKTGVAVGANVNAGETEGSAKNAGAKKKKAKAKATGTSHLQNFIKKHNIDVNGELIV